jgi:hypothetical protein
MKKRSKLPRGTVVVSATTAQKREIAKYLDTCLDVENQKRYDGTGDKPLGLDYEGIVCYKGTYGLTNKHPVEITYEQFQKLITEPELEQYPIF